MMAENLHLHFCNNYRSALENGTAHELCVHIHTHTQAPVTLLARELTDGLLSPTPSVPQLQCQEADSCPTGDKAGVHKDRPSKNI